jgi:NADH:ubiquinone oxidoreductase subunit K
MHPYRDLLPVHREDEDDGELRRDDQILAVLMIVVGGIRVALAIALDEAFGTEATLAGVAVGIGLALLVASFRRRI